MSEEKQPSGTAGEPLQPAGKPSPGERLDQLISGAKKLTDAASQKSNEFITQQRSSGSATQKVLTAYRGWGKRQKQIVFGTAAAVVLVLLVLGSILARSGRNPGPTKANFDLVQTGMSEDQVDKLLGMPTASAKGINGSMVKTWIPSARGDSAIAVVFTNGKADTKMMEGSTTVMPSSPIGTITSSNVSDYGSMDVPSLGLIIEEKLMPGQGLVPEGMWRTTIYPNICDRQYSLVARALKGLQMPARVSGECQRAMLALQQKVGIPNDPPPVNSVALPGSDKMKGGDGPAMPDMPSMPK
jgi:hypothetical protein